MKTKISTEPRTVSGDKVHLQGVQKKSAAATPNISDNKKQEIQQTIQQAARVFQVLEKRLDSACDQMSVLHSQISELKVRHQRALRQQNTAFSNSLQLRLQTLQGVYNMYYQYAELRSAQMHQLQMQVGAAQANKEVPAEPQTDNEP